MRWFLVLGLLAAIYCFALGDHYKTLGVARTATQSQIRSAFQGLSKKWYVVTLSLDCDASEDA